ALAAYVTTDRRLMQELGFAIAYDTTCQDVEVNSGELTPLDATTSVLPLSYVEARALDPIPILQLINAVP
ncbi:MAG: hypothetical protein AAF211_26665, partial [Myxococcota bacterium]